MSSDDEHSDNETNSDLEELQEELEDKWKIKAFPLEVDLEEFNDDGVEEWKKCLVGKFTGQTLELLRFSFKLRADEDKPKKDQNREIARWRKSDQRNFSFGLPEIATGEKSSEEVAVMKDMIMAGFEAGNTEQVKVDYEEQLRRESLRSGRRDETEVWRTPSLEESTSTDLGTVLSSVNSSTTGLSEHGFAVASPKKPPLTQ
ncbi:hypothetical protein FRX31_019528 [Thalictrum thalictroides]|uniref:Uncharacterized protein n=1 Tax=Thalictrum thalictroides TaxID=46969 RepID=A0A7J6W0I4_THATH|nr:hypothetical protein FRX31_019528 [Thalictrum thalictroides]